MKMYEVNTREELTLDVVLWMVGKGLTREQATALINKGGLDKYANIMRRDREKLAKQAKDIESGFSKIRELTRKRKENPDLVHYTLGSNKKFVTIGGNEVGRIEKRGDNWIGTLMINGKHYNIGPKPIMQLQDTIDLIAYGIDE